MACAYVGSLLTLFSNTVQSDTDTPSRDVDARSYGIGAGYACNEQSSGAVAFQGSDVDDTDWQARSHFIGVNCLTSVQGRPPILTGEYTLGIRTTVSAQQGMARALYWGWRCFSATRRTSVCRASRCRAMRARAIATRSPARPAADETSLPPARGWRAMASQSTPISASAPASAAGSGSSSLRPAFMSGGASEGAR